MLVPVCKILDFIEFCLNYQLHQKAVPQKSGVFKKKLMGSQNHHPKHATESDFCLKHDHNQFKTASNNDNTPKKKKEYLNKSGFFVACMHPNHSFHLESISCASSFFFSSQFISFYSCLGCILLLFLRLLFVEV